MLAPETEKPINTESPIARRVARGWAWAGVAAVAVSVIIASANFFGALSPLTGVLLTIGCGWLTLLSLAPWCLTRRLHSDDRQTLRQLNAHLESIVNGDRTIPMGELVLDRNDEIGDLSRTVHALAIEAHSNRRQSRLLHRTMDHQIELQTRRATAHLERQATTDPLTGLGNRRAMEQRLAELFNPTTAEGCDVTVMAIDLDHFKKVNDALGHDAGDRCLVFLADLLKSGMRREDSAIRLGGDEFVVLMPGRTMEEGRAAADRLASLFAQMPWPYTRVSRPTLSFGLASSWPGPANLNSAAELLRRADAALYASKQAGRAAVSEYGRQRGAA